MTERPLRLLLEDAHDGRIQVPEFQRELILADEWIKSVLASVSLRCPIGAVMLLRSGSRDLRFEARPVAGAPMPAGEPEWFLLDGQRRLTALYQVLRSGHVVQTQDAQGKPAGRSYYVDINTVLDPEVDRDEAILSVPADRHRREIAGGTTEWAWGQCLFPLRLVFGADSERRRWQRGFAEHGAADARDRLLDRFEAEFLDAFEAYRVPMIPHGRETARWSVRVHGGPDGRNLSDRFRVR